MSIERQLAEGETVLFRTRLHPVVLGWTAVFALVVLGIVALVIARNALATSTITLLWLGAAAVVVASSLLPWLRWRAGVFAVTPRRLLARLGLRTVYAIDLAEIEQVQVEASPWARLLGYGTVCLAGRDGTREAFAGVRHPEALCEALLRHRRAASRRKGP